MKDPGLPGMGLFTSLRPEMNWKTTCFVSPVSEYYTEVPAFPLNLLKHHVIDNLTDAVCSQTSQTRNWSKIQIYSHIDYNFLLILILCRQLSFLILDNTLPLCET